MECRNVGHNAQNSAPNEIELLLDLKLVIILIIPSIPCTIYFFKKYWLFSYEFIFYFTRLITKSYAVFPSLLFYGAFFSVMQTFNLRYFRILVFSNKKIQVSTKEFGCVVVVIISRCNLRYKEQ